MAIFFLILAGLALLNLVYEGIVAPTLRFNLRLKLFALRDELRELKIERGDEIHDDLFRDLQGSLNATINRLARIDLLLLKTAYNAFEHDDSLRRFAEQREAMLEACPVGEVKRIRDKQLAVVGCALAVNSGGWIPYLIPVVVGLVFAGSAMAIIKKLFSLPENDIDKIAPSDHLAPA